MASYDLPLYDFPERAEDFARGDIAQGCDPVDQPGVQFFARLILRTVGGRSISIGSCSRPKVSDHFEGRAWDWGVNANDRDEAEKAQAVLDWLFANEWEIYRRLGLKYVIWNRVFYQSGASRPYTGPSPHTDHVHFSFGWPGARGQTSFFRAAGFQGTTPAPPRPKPPAPLPPEPEPLVADTSTGERILVFGASAIASYFVIRAMT